MPKAGTGKLHETKPHSSESSFRDRFCRQFTCPQGEYEERAFSELLYRHARLPASVIRKLSPTFFRADFEFVKSLGEAASLREAKLAAAEFQDHNAHPRNLLRSGLRVRVSGLKATRLAQRLFSE